VSAEEVDHLAPQEVAGQISKDMVRIHEENYGSKVRSVETHIMDGFVLSILDIEMLPGERLLIEDGKVELVKSVRAGFQEAIDATFKAAVERATGRKVDAFISDTHVNPDFTIELFRLEMDGDKPSRTSPSSHQARRDSI